MNEYYYALFFINTRRVGYDIKYIYYIIYITHHPMPEIIQQPVVSNEGTTGCWHNRENITLLRKLDEHRKQLACSQRKITQLNYFSATTIETYIDR